MKFTRIALALLIREIVVPKTIVNMATLECKSKN